MPLPNWLFGHDPQKYAYDEFDAVEKAIRTNSIYVPTNVPPAGEQHRVIDFKAEDASPWLKTKEPIRIRAKL